MGWSVEQVADQLKLAVRQVIALEAGDYASLPSPAVTRGFVRAYAKLVKLDPAPLVAQIAMETEPAPDTSAVTATRRPTPASFSESRFPSHGKRSSLPLGWIAGGIVVVAAAAAGAWHFGLVPGGQRNEASTTTVTPPAANGVVTETPGTTIEPVQNPSVPLISVPGASATAPAAPATNAAPGPVVNVPGTTATGAPPTTIPAPAATPAVTQVPAAAAPAPAAAAPAAPAGANALVLNVREDSWIEVRPAKGGAPLLSRLVKGGSTETVNVEQPVRVVVGNPSGVTATLRGNVVALPPVPGKTLARVNLQ
jgi:cytoskeleton protein RodZ